MATVGANAAVGGQPADAAQPPPPPPASMFYDLPVMRIQGQDEGVNYQPHPKMMSNQSHAAKITEICSNLPKFGGREGESIEEFIKCLDAVMTNMHIASRDAATALFSPNSPLYGRAATFVNFARLDEELYPNATYWCAQDAQERREAVPYQKRRESIESIRSSHDSEATQASRETQGTIPDEPEVPADDTANPPVVYKAAVPGVSGEAKRTDPRTMRQARKPHKPAVHKRRRQRGREEIPAQPPQPAQPAVDPRQCLRHYMLGEFYQQANREEALKKFEDAKKQPHRMSVREYIWRLKMSHEAYKKARWGHQAEARKNKYREEDEENLSSIIRLNSIAEFKQFFQPKVTDNPKCMDTVRDCLKMAADFETLTEAGKRHTAACHSTAHVAQVMAANQLAQNLNPDSLLGQQQLQQELALQTNPQGQAMPTAAFQQPGNIQPGRMPFPDKSRSQSGISVPDSLVSMVTPEAWSMAVEAAGSAFRQADNNYHSAAAATPLGRGNGGQRRGGGRGNGKGRGGKAGTGQPQSQPQARPPPNPIPPGGSEFWHTISAMQEARCAHKNPEGRARCGYCGVPGHGYSGCGYKRKDLQNSKNWNVHPKRGDLPSKKHAFNKYVSYTKSKGLGVSSLTFSDFIIQNPNLQQQQSQVDPPQAAAAAPPPPTAREQQLMNLLAQTTNQLAQLQLPQAGVAAAAKVATAKLMLPEEPVVPMPQGNGNTLRNWADDLEPQPRLPPPRSAKEKDEAFKHWMTEQHREQQLQHEEMLHNRQQRQKEESIKQRLLQKSSASEEAKGELNMWHMP